MEGTGLIYDGLLMMQAKGILYVFSFLFGASVGSFLNVFIYRWPEGLSLVSPGSRCPSCETPIPFYWNVPVLSWLLLRGKCKWCGTGISPQYVLIELAMGVWCSFLLWRFGPTVTFLAYFVFSAALFGASIIDLRHRLLPDAVTLGSIPLGLALAYFYRPLDPAYPVTIWESVSGAAVGAGLFFVVQVVFKLASGKDGLGTGDVKLMGGFGAMFGVTAVPLIILLGSTSGIIAWLILHWRGKVGRDYLIPFGPFLAGAAVMVMLFRQWFEKNWFMLKWPAVLDIFYFFKY